MKHGRHSTQFSGSRRPEHQGHDARSHGLSRGRHHEGCCHRVLRPCRGNPSSSSTTAARHTDRWPGGVAEERFFEKQLPSSAPEWIERITIEHSDGPVTYPFAHEAATLAWFAQQNALELHVPQWRAFGSSRRVDRLVFDLDPGPGRGLTDCAEVAFWLKERLDDAGMSTVPVTSGSKGLHLYARWKQSDHGTVTTSEFAKSLAEDAARAMPSLATPVLAKAERSKKVLIDWSQNDPNERTITPYSLRGRDIHG